MRSPLYPVQELKRRVLAWAVKLRVCPRVIRVQPMRHKWGPCSARGTVTLAVDLAEQDEAFQQYVIVHELLHLRLPTHGRLFTVLMNAHVPGWQRFDRSRRVARRPVDQHAGQPVSPRPEAERKGRG